MISRGTSVCAAWVVAIAPATFMGCPIHEATNDHRDTEGEENTKRVHLENANVGNYKRHQRSEITEGAGYFHMIEAVMNWRGNCRLIWRSWHERLLSQWRSDANLDQPDILSLVDAFAPHVMPLCRRMRSLDVTAAQTGAIALGSPRAMPPS
jgi:hypothetical protein